VFNLGPARIGGDTNTVAQAGVRALDPLGPHGAIANHRTVVDLADPDRSRYVVAGGQSGNPLSPHYGDLFALWVRGEGVPIPWSPDAVEAAVVDVLTLTPTNPGVSDR
jgi:penicillin amidase